MDIMRVSEAGVLVRPSLVRWSYYVNKSIWCLLFSETGLNAVADLLGVEGGAHPPGTEQHPLRILAPP